MGASLHKMCRPHSLFSRREDSLLATIHTSSQCRGVLSVKFSENSSDSEEVNAL